MTQNLQKRSLSDPFTARRHQSTSGSLPEFDMWQTRKQHSPSVDTIIAHSMDAGSDAPKPAPGVKQPEIAEPHFVLPTEHFSLHHHLRFNPPPQGPVCNCGTWQIWCLPPHLGGCGHIYVQDMLYCGRTIDADALATAMAAACPGVDMHRPIRSAALMMGLCPSCRNDKVVVQTYNNFMAPFFVPKGLSPMKTMEAEEAASSTWRAHRLAFVAWVTKNRGEGVIH